MNPTPVFSVVITTRGRAPELRRALQSCEKQLEVPFEILVYDDASEDDTREVVSREFPHVRFFREEEPVGYIVLRNRGFKDALGKYVVSIDDDAWFSSATCLKELQKTCNEHSGAAAIAIKYFEPSRASDFHFMPETASGTQVRNYIGCAHCINRELAIDLGGYREFFVHQGEERDLCIRLLQCGHSVIYGNITPIIHDPSHKRDQGRLRYYGVRNTLLFDMLNIPFPAVIFRFVADTIQLFRYKLGLANVFERTWIVAKSVASSLTFLGKRKPVSKQVYYSFRKLPIHGPEKVELESVENMPDLQPRSKSFEKDLAK